MKKIILNLCLFASALLQGKIVETVNMSEVYKHLTPETLIVFDIDNTLIEPVQELGNDQWFYHRLKELEDQGRTSHDALGQTLREWHAMQNLTEVRLVEAGTDEIVRDLQSKEYMIIGLTTRGFQLDECTVHQLKSVSVNLALNAPTQDHVYFQNPKKGVLFSDGILFTQATNKGKALKRFMDELNIKPKNIVFINDKATHLHDVEDMCENEGIPFIGLRYGYLDEKVKSFHKGIAKVQYHNFGNLITDQEAEQLLKNGH